MHVLITSDTVGGVWTYTQELVTGLVRGGHRLTLVSFGKLPFPHQTAWMQTLQGLDYRPTEYRLEWMEVAEKDIEESKHYLELLIKEVQPDVLHFSQYCYGDIATDIPKIVVAHSDIVSWWVAVHGCEPDDTPWMRRYRETVSNGLRGADVVMVLRVQRERLAGLKLSLPDYISRYQITMTRLRLAKNDALLMHPGPIIRGLEITWDVADCPQSVIVEEVKNGVPLRMAVLARALGKN